MDGLIIKRQWIDLILSGKKTLEIRGSDTKKSWRGYLSFGKWNAQSKGKMQDLFNTPYILQQLE